MCFMAMLDGGVYHCAHSPPAAAQARASALGSSTALLSKGILVHNTPEQKLYFLHVQCLGAGSGPGLSFRNEIFRFFFH